jgi:hypothetical protein
MRTSSALKFYATRFSGQCVALRAALRRRYGLVAALSLRAPRANPSLTFF